MFNIRIITLNFKEYNSIPATQFKSFQTWRAEKIESEYDVPDTAGAAQARTAQPVLQSC